MIKLINGELNQWEQFRMVEIVTDNTLLEVLFYNGAGGHNKYISKPLIDEEGRKGAIIPNILLTNHGVITVITKELQEDGSLTTQKQTFEVEEADKPNDYKFISDAYTSIVVGCD